MNKDNEEMTEGMTADGSDTDGSGAEENRELYDNSDEASELSEEKYADGEEDGDDFDAPNESENAENTVFGEKSEPDEEMDIDVSPPLSRRAAKEARQRARKRITQSKIFKILLIVLGAVLAAAIILYAVCAATLPDNTILRNVYVEELDMSGLTYSQALTKIKKAYLLEDREITLSCDGHTYSILGADVSLTASPEETAKKAYDFGRSGSRLVDGFTAFTLVFRKHSIIPSASFDEEQMRGKINEFGNEVYGERRNHYVEILDGKTIVWPGETGYGGNSDAALAEITDAVKNEKFTNIHVTLASAPPDELTLEQFDATVYTDPVDAHFEVENNEVKIVEETNGRYIDKEEAAALLANVAEGGGPIEIPYYYSYPSVLSSDLSGKLFANTMAAFSTSYASSNANRASNVARAASLINGKILAPGEVFSFNGAVGKRTVENGFKTAPEYVDGKTVDGIGGGTCQVSSTLYNAVLYADLEIVTRTNHMFTVSYVPNGQDATVADSGPDFKFKNNTNYPIKISASTGGGTITVSVIGTNWEPKREVKISNSSSVSANGDTHVKTTRTVYVNGSVLRTDSLPSSTYKKHVEETQSNSGSSGSTSSSAAASSASAQSAQSAPQSVSAAAQPETEAQSAENTQSEPEAADTSASEASESTAEE